MSAEDFSKGMTKKKVRVEKVYQVKAMLRELNINTVCESTKCPNIGECFSKPRVTFIILGDMCPRGCSFCAVDKGEPKQIDFHEPKKIAKAAQKLGLKHTIISSVCRDDLADNGAYHFAHTIYELKMQLPHSTIEVLAPHFNANTRAIRTVLEFNPHIFNHNIGTVPCIYAKVRSRGNYEKSLKVLKMVKRMKPKILTKSGLMVGLGETEDEVLEVMKDLRGVKCDILTIGQYLQPTRYNIPVDTFVIPEIFMKYKKQGMAMGFLQVISAPYVRSSYNTESYMMDSFETENTMEIKDGAISSYQEASAIRI